jgi:hypothetical protein
MTNTRNLTSYIFSVCALIVSCNQGGSSNAINNKDTTHAEIGIINSDTVQHEEQAKKISFKNVSEIVAESSSSIWVEKQGTEFSLALNFQYQDTLDISYSPECWLMYPYKLEGNKIIVYWNNDMDSKYEFNIIKAVNKIDKKYLGKPFMELELENDTTLKATYLIKDIIRKINSSDKVRTLFPERFYVEQENSFHSTTSNDIPPNGKYRFDMAFAEWQGQSMGEKVTVLINDLSIKVIYEGDGQLTQSKKGEVFEEGKIMKHKSGVWIIGKQPSDAQLDEIGGCTGGPTIIDFENKKYWTC